MIESRADYNVMMGLIASFAIESRDREELPPAGAMMVLQAAARECAEFVERQKSATVIALNAARSRRMFTRSL